MDLPGSVRASIGVIGKSAIELAEASVIAAYPWLGLPVIKQIWEAILEHFTSALILELQNGSTTLLMPIIDQAQADAADKASADLQQKLNAANTTAEALQGSLDEFKQKYADLIRMREST